MDLQDIFLILFGIILGVVIGYFIVNNILTKRQEEARKSASHIIAEAEKEATNLKKEKLLEAKEENQKLREAFDRETSESRDNLKSFESRLLNRETTLDTKSELLDKKDEMLDSKEAKIEEKQQMVDAREKEINEIISQQNSELTRISGLTRDEAKEEIFAELEKELSHDMAVMVKEKKAEMEQTVEKDARELLATVAQRYAAEYTSESTVSVVNLPNDEMKGRIIGREGRNIRTIETLTGVDLIIDDTPEAVILSGFDPIRRTIAKNALEELVKDGRIHPGRIEEMVDKARRNIESEIRDAGEQAAFEVDIHNLHPELIKHLGKMKFRLSYGQNVLKHSVEVGFLSGMLAAELGLDVSLARRAGLLHDIGKSIDHEIEGSHVEIGVNLAKRYKESDVVINAIESHHGDVEPNNIISIIVAAADALSAARPGARRETLENYVKRLENLEQIALGYKGVEKSFAIQAGREIRIMVSPEEIDDVKAHRLARDIKAQIEDELQYPGHIKVTVVREMRAVEYAK